MSVSQKNELLMCWSTDSSQMQVTFTILSSWKNKNYDCDSTEREIKGLFLILIVDTEDFSNSLESYFTQSKWSW